MNEIRKIHEKNHDHVEIECRGVAVKADSITDVLFLMTIHQGQTNVQVRVDIYDCEFTGLPDSRYYKPESTPKKYRDTLSRLILEFEKQVWS